MALSFDFICLSLINDKVTLTLSGTLANSLPSHPPSLALFVNEKHDIKVNVFVL